MAVDTEGHLTMPANRRSTIVLVVLVILVFSPMPVWGSTTSNSTHSVIMSTDLMNAITASQPDDTIAVVAQYPEGSSPELMITSLLASGINSIQIRHAFNIMPMISFYVKSSDVTRFSQDALMVRLMLDINIGIAAERLPNQAIIAANGDGYTHFTTLMDAEGLWNQGYNGSGIVVAVIDSGVDGNHPDLENRLIGFKDLINGRDDMTPANGVDAYDDNGHGTACAWNVAGDGSASGGNLTGVAPGARILAIKVLNKDGSGDDSVIAQGIEFAMANSADVISLSLGGQWTDNTFTLEPSVAACQAAVEAGISVVVAAGNSGPQAFSINSPGITEEAITVGASSGTEGVVAFSSVGPVLRTTSQPKGYVAKPDVVAPGYNVVSGKGASADPVEYPEYNYTQFSHWYTIWSGTSASAPMIAGAVALLAQKHLTLTPEEAKTALMISSTDLNLDPMVQGWGLVNVTRASQILGDTARDITIMTPKRFPTLPWSSKVLIVGDDRPPQNITVISSVQAGTATIAVTGNASQYVHTNVNQVTVVSGYSHFGIYLSIPNDLPLSNAGYYAGTLNLTVGSTTIASIDIEYTITLFGGRLMVDMAHHSADDPDDPSYYGYFTEYLRERGVLLSEFGSPDDIVRKSIDLGSLSASDVFMIMDTETPYSESEITAIHEFVANGGTLIMLSEFWDSSTQTASFGIDSYNLILEPFGIQCERNGIGDGPGSSGLIYGTATGSVVENVSLMEGVTSLYIVQGSTLHVDPSVSNAQGLFWVDSAKTHAIVATAEYGNGKVFVISDGSTLYDDILFDAIRLGANNLRLLRNLADAILPEAPRIYDVEMNMGNFGEPANITAYVFDSDLENVTINILGPGNINLTGPITESLGYKFSSTFIFNSGGFYSIRVEASDSTGNVRIFQKTILVPVDAANDIFVQAVIYTLLGVVGVGLVYVGWLKYGVGRKLRHKVTKKDEEWELPPPSIE
jgi:subtilisin family serine protease